MQRRFPLRIGALGSGNQFTEIERLRQVVVRPEVQELDLPLNFVAAVRIATGALFRVARS